MHQPRWTRSKLIAAPIVAATALIALAGPAFAHVDAAGQTAATGITTVTFTVEHGCGTSPTTSMKIELPTGTTEVKAQETAGFTAAATADTLTWSGGSLPAEGTFVADMRIVGTAGDTIFLPTIQGCTVGENDWIEKTDDPEADNAAPRFTLLQTVAPASSTTSTTAAGSTSTTKATSTTQSVTETTSDAAAKDAQIVKDSDNSPIGSIVIIIVVLIIAGGALILYLRNRRPKGPGTAGPSEPAGPASSSGPSGE
jgi:uncharacterized protein YcnI